MNYVGQHRAPRPLLRRPVVAVVLLALVVGGPSVAMATLMGPAGSDDRPGTTIAPIASPTADQHAIDWPEDREIQITTPPVTSSSTKVRPSTTPSPELSSTPDVIRTTFAAHIVITTPVTTNRVTKKSTTTTTTRKTQRPDPDPTPTVPETSDPSETPEDTPTPESSS